MIDLPITLGGLIVGFIVGMTGVGGGALMTPMLVLIFGVPPLAAVSSDVVAAVIMKPIGGGVHLRRGTVKLGLVKWLMVGSLPCAFLGVVLLKSTGSGEALQAHIKLGLGYALLLASVGIVVRPLLVRGRREVAADAKVDVKILPTLLIGAFGGLIVGMTSVGSGSLMIVLLLLLYPQFRLSDLVGTDLVQAIPLVSSAALGHLLLGDFKLALTGSILTGAIPGVYLGARLSSRAPDGLLRPVLVTALSSSALKLLSVSNVVLAVVVPVIAVFAFLTAIPDLRRALALRRTRRLVVGGGGLTPDDRRISRPTCGPRLRDAGTAIVSVAWKRGVRNGLEVVELATPASTCSVALHGAQVLTFVPRGDPDWLWVSDRARWTSGAALRGGIPICFPWFGPHPTETSFPAHGFARTRIWRLSGVDEVAGERLRAMFELGGDGATAPLFPHPFRARHSVTAGDDLELSFEVTNEGDGPLAFEVALHTYVAVSDVGVIALAGLGGSSYVDKVAGGERRRQGDEPLRILGEVDRVYDSGEAVTLADPARAQPLRIESGGAGSTVVWNPGPDKARALPDMDPDGFRRFVCVETGNVGARRITLPPGGHHALSVRYRAGAR